MNKTDALLKAMIVGMIAMLIFLGIAIFTFGESNEGGILNISFVAYIIVIQYRKGLRK